MLFTGVDYHVTQIKEDIIVSLHYIDRPLGRDTPAKTVTVEPGMKVSTLSSILATINLSVDLAGRVPDLTITDCLAVGGPGLGCGGAGMGASVISVQVNTRLLLAAHTQLVLSLVNIQGCSVRLCMWCVRPPLRPPLPG